MHRDRLLAVSKSQLFDLLILKEYEIQDCQLYPGAVKSHQAPSRSHDTQLVFTSVATFWCEIPKSPSARAAGRRLVLLMHAELQKDFVQLMAESAQVTLSNLADEFGYLEECQAGSTALSLQCHSKGQQGDLATQQCQIQMIYSCALPHMTKGVASTCLPLVHK